MAQYEYKQVATNIPAGSKKFIFLLNEIGKEGWELVTVVTEDTENNKDYKERVKLAAHASRNFLEAERDINPDINPQTLLIFIRRKPR